MAVDKSPLVKRIFQSLIDLNQAHECARQILQRDLYSSREPSDRALMSCLLTALVITYARPFMKSRGKAMLPKLPSEYLELLSEEQKKLHKNLIDLRNQTQAHSDSRALDVSVIMNDIDGFTYDSIHRFSQGALVSRTLFHPPEFLLKEIVELIDCLRGKLLKDLRQLLPSQ